MHVEQRVNIGTEQQPIRGVMIGVDTVRDDMGSLNQPIDPTIGHHTSLAVSSIQIGFKLRLPWSRFEVLEDILSRFFHVHQAVMIVARDYEAKWRICGPTLGFLVDVNVVERENIMTSDQPLQ